MGNTSYYKVTKIFYFIFILIFASCDQENKIILSNNAEKALFFTENKEFKNYINFDYYDNKQNDFELEIQDSVYYVRHNNDLLQLLDFKADSSFCNILDPQNQDKISFVKRNVLKVKYSCLNESTLSFFIIKDFISSDLFGKMNLFVICDYQKGILGSFFTPDSESIIPDEGKKFKKSRVFGYEPNCLKQDTLFEQITYR